MAQAIVITDLKNIGAQIAEALKAAGIDASQFGDIDSQIQTALGAAGIAVPTPEVVEPVVESGPAFGERLDYKSDENVSTLVFNAEGAVGARVFQAENGNLRVELTDEDGEVVSEEFGIEDKDDLVNASATFDGEVLTVFVPAKAVFTGEVTVFGFEDGDDFAGEADEDGEWCEECQEYHS